MAFNVAYGGFGEESILQECDKLPLCQGGLVLHQTSSTLSQKHEAV